MMSNSVLLLTLAIVSAVMLMTNASPINTVSNSSITVTPTTTPITEQHFSLSTTKYTAMLSKVVGAWQSISRVFHLITEQNTVTPFEYCFINIINLPRSHLTIEGRLFFDYKVLKVLTAPLRDIVNYEANHTSNDSYIYEKLSWAQEQINSSLEEIQNMLNSDHLTGYLSDQEDSELSTSNNSTSTNTTQLQGQCMDGVTSSTDEYRDLFEIYVVLNFVVWDLLRIEHDLDPHYPHGNN